jgi:hypothetical protein
MSVRARMLGGSDKNFLKKKSVTSSLVWNYNVVPEVQCESTGQVGIMWTPGLQSWSGKTHWFLGTLPVPGNRLVWTDLYCMSTSCTLVLTSGGGSRERNLCWFPKSDWSGLTDLTEGYTTLTPFLGKRRRKKKKKCSTIYVTARK